MDKEMGGLSASMKAKAKRAALGTLITIGTAGGAVAAEKVIEQGMEQIHEREEAYRTLDTLAMTTPMQRAEATGALSIERPEMTAERQENIAAVDAGYTELVAADGFAETFAKTCGEELEDGSVTLHALKCNDFYGDQYKLSADSIQALADAYGYTPEEVTLHGEVMRGSMVGHGLVVGAEGLSAVGYYDDQRLPDAWRASKGGLYDGYYEDASALTFQLIKDLDLTHADKETKQAAELAMAELIKADIERENRTLLVSNDISHLAEEYNREALIGGYVDQETKEKKISHIEELQQHEEAAKAAWRKVLQLEANPKGPIHELATGHVLAHEGIMQDILKTGKTAGIEEDFLTQQYNNRIAALDVGDKGLF